MKAVRSIPDPSWGLPALGVVLLVSAIAWIVVSLAARSDDPEMRRLITRLDAAGEPNSGVRIPGTVDGTLEENFPASVKGAPGGVAPGTRDRLDRLETAFTADPEDPSSTEVESRLRDTAEGSKLLASGIRPEGVDVKCRRSMCRLVADFRNDDDATDWAALYLALLEADVVSNRQVVFAKSANGGVQARLFAIRVRGKSR